MPQQLIKLLVLSTCISLAHQAYSKDMDGEFVVFSIGANTCKDYLNSRRKGVTALEPYKQWLMGYLSAFNLIVVNTYDIAGQSRYPHIISWLDNYCVTNKTESFVNASAALTVSLYPDRHNMGPNKQTQAKWNESGDLFTGDESEEELLEPK